MKYLQIENCLEPITNETLQKFDNYEINEIEKFICRFKNQINHEINLNNGIKINSNYWKWFF
jgi:hypothetical protein